jgi:hypothetical protein
MVGLLALNTRSTYSESKIPAQKNVAALRPNLVERASHSIFRVAKCT